MSAESTDAARGQLLAAAAHNEPGYGLQLAEEFDVDPSAPGHVVVDAVQAAVTPEPEDPEPEESEDVEPEKV